MSCPTSSPSSPGTLPARGARATRPRGSVSTTTPTASPDSWPGWSCGAPCLVGLSFGGILALALQRRHSGLADRLILASRVCGLGGIAACRRGGAASSPGTGPGGRHAGSVRGGVVADHVLQRCVALCFDYEYVLLEDMVGDNAATNSSGVPSARASAWRRRCSATSAGSDPAQPAYAEARISRSASPEVSPLERQREDASERQPDEARAPQLQPGQESGEAVGVVVETKPLGRVARAPRAGDVPGDDGELVDSSSSWPRHVVSRPTYPWSDPPRVRLPRVRSRSAARRPRPSPRRWAAGR